MSLLLEALKKAEKAKRGPKPPAQAEKEAVAPVNAAPEFDLEAPAPPVMVAEAQMSASESAFPEIMQDEVAPSEPPLAMTELQPEPDAREPLLFMPDPAILDMPEMELAGMRRDAQTEAQTEAEPKTEPVLSLDFLEPEPIPQPAPPPMLLAFEPAPAIAHESQPSAAGSSSSPQQPEPLQPDNSPITLGQRLAARPAAHSPMPDYSAPPPPAKAADDAGQAMGGGLPPNSQAGQAGMGGSPPNSQVGQAGMGGLPPNSHKTPEQEAAKKILAAKQGKPKRNPKLLAGLLVFSMVVGAAAAYFYWQVVTQPTMSFPTQQTAETPPEASVPQQPAVADGGAAQPAPAQPPAGDAGTGEEASAGADSAAQTGQAGMGGAPTDSPKPPRREPAVDAARTPRGGQEKSVEKPAAAPKQRDATPVEAPPAKMSNGSPVEPDKAAVKPPAITGHNVGGIKIRRDAGEAKLDPLLASAYQAFMAGETGKAEADYRKVLQKTPNSRDALLGLAAIAAGRNQTQEAASLYLRMLQLDPGDSAAQTGMIGLKGHADPTMSESRLKMLLAQSPGTGYLHFALGNLYAQQSRWPEAQEAYFNALHTDSGNADYAFNLAVSLDHLDQRKPALVYYRRALSLVKNRPAGFDGEQVEKRIYELQRPD